MVNTKIIESTRRWILLIYLALFPFGQLPSLMGTLILGTPISIHPTDLLVILFVGLSFVLDKTLLSKFIYSFIAKLFCIFILSFLVGVIIFHFYSFLSFLYLVRLLSYLLFAFILWTTRPLTKSEITVFFVSFAFFVSALGILQYLLLPDTRFLKILGWDDHYYRLLSSFLDPAFTGILLVFSLLFMSLKWVTKNKLIKYGGILLTTIALLLTYSRASFLALGVGILVYVIYRSSTSLKYLLWALLFGISVLLLPRPNGGEGVKLERTFSLFSKLQNATETTQIFSLSPVYGVGYNNICMARELIDSMSSTMIYSHSCSGADNSLLFMLSTIGIVGTLTVGWGITGLLRRQTDPFVISIAAALFTHTMFTNTLFYPWVFVWVVLCFVLYGV